MTPEERLAALLAEAKTLKAKAAGTDFTDEDATRVVELTKEIDDVRAVIARKQAATDALGSIDEPEQSSRDDAPAPRASKAALSLGERFIQSDARKAFKDENRVAPTKGDPIRIEAKGLGRFNPRKKVLDTAGTGQAAPVRSDEVDDLVYRPARRLLELVTTGTTDTEWTQYRQIISKTNNAAVVAEATTNNGTGVAGGVKPISSLVTALADAKAVTVADGMEVTNQELMDDGIIQTLIDSTLTENLEIAIENLILNGDSSADPEQPDGILNTTGVLEQAFAVDMPTSIRKAITKLRTTSGAQIKGVLLNPEDDEAWDLLKDDNQRYLGQGPFGQGPSTAWGYERIESEVIPVGMAVVGDFSTIHLLTYEQLSILAFNQHKDYAQRNLVYIRAEQRIKQMIRNAAKLCVVELVSGV